MSQLQVGATLSSGRSTGQHLGTMLFGTWLIGGVFVDGFAHNHGVVETFFTPWHAILYSGFVATALWILGVVYRNHKKSGQSWVRSIPQGYGIGVIGIFVFLLGGLGDMAWHTIFGIEKNVAALLSPTHLILLLGALMILTSPFRVGWLDPEMVAPSWRKFLPTLLSVELTTSAVAFFLMYAWMFRFNLPSQPNVTEAVTHISGISTGAYLEHEAQRGLAYIVLDTVVMMYPILLMMSRWKTPFGTFALHMTFLGVTMNVLDGFVQWPTILIMLVAGLVADVLYRFLRPGVERMWAYRVIALAVPVVVWGLYYLCMQIAVGIGWDPELWSGSMVEAALASLGLSLLAIPPRRA